MLLTDKLTNELLLKNHDLRPTDNTIVLETLVGSNKSSSHFKGCGQMQECDFWSDGGKSEKSN